MTNFQKYLFILFLVAGVFLAGSVFSLSKDDIVFPVAELGNCQDEAGCRAYCEDPANIEQCIAFAEKHNLLSEREIEKARKFQSIGALGPGGCTSERECEAYCENVNNIEECLAFAEQYGFVQEEELHEIRQVAQALRSGAQLPGGCTGKASCEAYCSDLNNMRECIAFAEQAGFMSPEELREAKQVLKALDAGLSLPGNCRGEDECEAYCEDPAHAQECVEFALAAGFIPPEEADEVRRILPLMKEGKMPGGCRSKESCEAYCSQEQNIEECTTFFTKAGFMTPEEAELFRKTGGKGPGGCKGERECETFCNDPAHQEECFAFAEQHGLIGEEELADIKEGTKMFKQGLELAPSEVVECLRDTIGQEKLDKIQAGTLLPNPKIGEHMRRCFELQFQIFEQKTRSCLALSCDQFFSCMDEASWQGGGFEGPGPREGEHEGEEPGLGSGLEQEIAAKYESCFQEGGEFPGQGFIPGFEAEQKTPEQVKCIEGIIGFIDNPRSPQEEERIARECFGAGEFFPRQGDHFEGQGPQGEFEQQFQEEFQQQFEQRFQEQFQQEFERREQEEIQRQQQLQSEQFEQLIPPAPHIEGAPGPSPEEIQRIEQEEAARLEQQRLEEEARRQQLEQELQQQFQELEQLQQQQLQGQETPAGGSVLDVFLYFLKPLLRY